MKTEEIKERESRARGQPITAWQLTDAAYHLNNSKYSKVDGVYHMEPNTYEAEVEVARSPLKINLDKSMISLSDVIKVEDRHFRAGAVQIRDLHDGTTRTYLVVSQFYP